MSRREVLSWKQIPLLIEHLVSQLDQAIDTLLMVNPSGLITGGLVATRIRPAHVHAIKIDFPALSEPNAHDKSNLLALPKFVDFPSESQLKGQSVLLVDANWGCGRVLAGARRQVENAGGLARTAVLHFSPPLNNFQNEIPDYYASITDAEIIYPWDVDLGKQTRYFTEPRTS